MVQVTIVYSMTHATLDNTRVMYDQDVTAFRLVSHQFVGQQTQLGMLNQYRNEIDSIPTDTWKKVRWYINLHDFTVKTPFINRAFYKYWEIIHEFDLFAGYTQDDIVFHCAEAPGGFIQGTHMFLQQSFKKKATHKEIDSDGFETVKSKKKRIKEQSTIFSMSLNKELPKYKAYNLPCYNRKVLTKNVCITFGVDNSGDITNFDNIHHVHTLSQKPFYLITADGGFDEGSDFNNKEQLHYTLILSEIYAALSLQRQGGHFVLKMFDVFTETSTQLLYVLGLCYSEVHVYKPKTSRPTNSEKYVICKHFKATDATRDALLALLQTANATCCKNKEQKYLAFTLFDSIEQTFRESVDTMNKLFLQSQCEYLRLAITRAKDDAFLKKYDSLLEASMPLRSQVYTTWEQKYNLHMS